MKNDFMNYAFKLLPVLLPVILIGFALWWLYKKFFGKTVQTIYEEKAKEQGIEKLSNGMTYAEAAAILYKMMFSGGFAGMLFYNTDEDALGEFLLTVRSDEYRKLETVYNAFKDDKNPWITVWRGGSLSEDLRTVFNKKEQQKYMSHLVVL